MGAKSLVLSILVRINSQMWWHTPVVLVLERLGQEDSYEFEVSLDCIVNSKPEILSQQNKTKQNLSLERIIFFSLRLKPVSEDLIISLLE